MLPKINELAEGLLRHYNEIRNQIGSLATAESNFKKTEVMSQIRLHLSRVKDLEVELFPMRDQWLEAGNELPDETADLFQQAAKVVGELLPRINELEQQARKEREELAPVIHDGVRGMQMQSAYSQNR